MSRMSFALIRSIGGVTGHLKGHEDLFWFGKKKQVSPDFDLFIIFSSKCCMFSYPQKNVFF